MSSIRVTCTLLLALCTTLARAGLIQNIQDPNAVGPKSNPNPIAPQTNSACSPGLVVKMDESYGADKCPPVNKFDDATQSCPAYQQADDCEAYCEIRQRFFYDQEKPIANSICHGPLTCTVTEMQSETYTYDVGFNAGFSNGLSLGITGGLHAAYATTNMRQTSIPLADGVCGYFTFLPVLHESCGTVTYSAGSTDHNCRPDTAKNVGNVCVTQPHRTVDLKQVMGTIVFVKINCADHSRLPMDQQDPAYQKPGVAAPQSVYMSFINTISAGIQAAAAAADKCTPSPECQQPSGPFVNKACTCTCNGQNADLKDDRCKGFQGALPPRPPRV